MKKISIIVLAVLFFSSCGIFKKRTVSLQTKSADTSIKLDSSTKNKSIIVDKTETVVVEKAKGIVYSRPVNEVVNTDMSELLSGLRIVRDSGLVKIIQSYDSVTDKIETQVTVKSQPVEYSVDKTTTVKNDIKTENESKVDLKKDTKVSTVEKDKNTTSTPDTKLYVFLGLLIIVVVIYFSVKRKTGL